MKRLKTICKNKLFIIICFFMYAFILSLSDICFPGREIINYWDGSIYQYIGHLMLKGKLPYLDAFDHKGFLLYCLNALGCVINEKYGIWIINFLFMFVILYFSYKILRIYLQETLSLFFCIFIYSDFANGSWVWNTPDYFTVLFELIVVYYFTKSTVNNTKLKTLELIIIGTCISCGFWFKHTSILPAVILIFFAVINEIVSKNYKNACRYILSSFIGFSSISAVIISYLAYRHAIRPMFEDYFIYNLRYSSDDTSGAVNTFSILLYHLNNTSMLLTIILIIIYICIKISDHKKDRAFRIEKDLSYGFLVLVLYMIFLTLWGREYRQYYLNFYPIIVMISGNTLRTIKLYFHTKMYETKNTYINKNFLKRMIYLILIFIIFFDFYGLYCQTIFQNWRGRNKSVICEYIKDICGPEDTIAIVNQYDAGLYIASGHESATKYPYVQTLMFNDNNFINQYNSQIMINQPKLIICMDGMNENVFLNQEIMKEFKLHSKIKDYKIFVR